MLNGKQEQRQITMMFYFKPENGWVWWGSPIIPAFRKLRNKHGKFKASLGNIVRPYLKKPIK
jgi:hypothetical protein